MRIHLVVIVLVLAAACAPHVLSNPDLMRLDMRQVTVPVMLNRDPGAPAGRKLQGSAHMGYTTVSHSSSWSDAYYNYTVDWTESRSQESGQSPGAQIAGWLTTGDTLLLIDSIVFAGEQYIGFGTDDVRCAVAVDARALQGGAR